MGLLYKKDEEPKAEEVTPEEKVVPAAPMKSETVDKFKKFGVKISKLG